MGGGGGKAVGGVWAARSRRTSNFFCRRACRTEKARGPSTARRPARPAPSAAIFPTPPPQATRRSAQDDRLLENTPGGLQSAYARPMTPNKILVANIGSTSFKFRLIEMPGERVLAKGGVERIGSGESTYKYQLGADSEQKGVAAFPDYEAAIAFIEKALGGFGELAAVGF